VESATAMTGNADTMTVAVSAAIPARRTERARGRLGRCMGMSLSS
jgi:hypothetical protein